MNGRSWGLLLVLSFGTGLTLDTVQALRLEAYRDLLAMDLVADHLRDPAGLAVDPISGLLYVAERAGHRVSVVYERQVLSVLEKGFAVSDEVPTWAISDQRPERQWTAPQFQSPSSLAFDPEGRLYVTESGRYGRLLRFEPLYDGLAHAQVVTPPWIDDTHAFESVQVDAEGRVYASMRGGDPSSILAFGRVIMKETDGEWWMVDYGPFAEFSNVVLSPDGQSLIFAERRTAEVTWYDTTRQMLYGVKEGVHGVRHIALLPDGTTLASLERTDGTWSIVEVDSADNRMWEWVGGLSAIGGILAHPTTGDLYVSLASEGKIIRIKRVEAKEMEEDKLGKLLQRFEFSHALAPTEWPDFFKRYVEELGLVEPVDQIHSSLSPVERSLARVPMSMDEFASAIPVVAAKLKATLLSPAEQEKDPINEVSFVLFYPNRSMVTQTTVAPSISLFRAVHDSGRIERTRFLPNKEGKPLTEDLDWEEVPEVLVSFPSGYYANRTGLSEDGLLRVYFLGMGLGSDFWIDVHRLDKNRSIMVVEKPDGTKLEYALEPFEESIEAGGESVLVAGLTDVEKGWSFLGQTPVIWNIVMGETRPLNTRNMVKLEKAASKSGFRETSMATPFERITTREDIRLRRSVVLRAATRWSDTHL